jgi:hypothetical protein
MARSGMTNLIQRVRGLSDAGLADYTAGAVTYFSDDHIQEILDSNAALLIDTPLDWRPQTIGGGTVSYQIAQAAYRDLEEAASGTARWIVRTGTGDAVGTANYSTDYRAGRLTFTADQGGSAYFLTAYTYDVYQAAADVWRQRLANFADWYKFSLKAGDTTESFDRQQAFEHAREMINEMEQKAGSNVITVGGGDVRVSQFVRSDISYSGGWDANS